MKRTIGTALAAVTLLALFAAPAEAARPVPTCSIYHVVREDGVVLWFINVDNAIPGQRIVVTATDRPDVDNVFELTGVTSLTDRQVHGSSGTEDVTATVRVESGQHVLCTASDAYTVPTWSCSFTVSDPVPGDGLSDYTWSVTTNTTDPYYGTILSTDANYAYLIPTTTGSSSGTLTLLDTDENGAITYLFFATLYTDGEVCRAFEAAALEGGAIRVSRRAQGRVRGSPRTLQTCGSVVSFPVPTGRVSRGSWRASRSRDPRRLMA